MEIISLKASFASKLNPDGLSPLHLAVQSRQSEIVMRLVAFDKELVRLKGRGGATPLHLAAAQDDDCHLLARFLFDCPESINDRTVHDETALHIAVKKSNVTAVEVLLGWIRKTNNTGVLNRKDKDGNTVLHLAIVELLVAKKGINKDEVNKEGDTALDVAEGLPQGEGSSKIKKILRDARASKSSTLPSAEYRHVDYLKSPEQFVEIVFKSIILGGRYLSTERRNLILVVAVLIATSTFQAILQPPGGLLDHGDNNGNGNLLTNGTVINATMSTGFPANITHMNATISTTATTSSNATNHVDRVLFKRRKGKDITYGNFFSTFYLMNTLVFLASTTVIIIALQPQPFLIFWTLLLSLAFLMVSYGFAFMAISPSYSYALATLLVSYAISSVVYAFKIIIYHIEASARAGVKYTGMTRLQMKRLQMLASLLNH
ncbi:hypothetical protein NMG60_11027427 [Bertholletia excelsa]